MRSCFIVIVIFWTSFINVTQELEMRELKSMEGRFCGSKLADILRLVCGSVHAVQKEDDQKMKNGDTASLLMTREDIKSRHLSGIVYECCYNACTLWDMIKYCE